MSTAAVPAMPVGASVVVPTGLSPRIPPVTANDRFHQAFGAILWVSLILATGVHLAMFSLWPSMVAKDISYGAMELTAIELPPEIDIPDAPQPIARPAVPVMATTEISPDITIAPTTFESNPVSQLPPPPAETATRAIAELAAAPVFTPYTVSPEIRNRDEVRAALEREYPPLLRDAGVGGTVQVWFFIDAAGKLERTLVKVSSGHNALDEAALKVADLIRFTPALNRDKPVPVWISLPITFTVR